MERLRDLIQGRPIASITVVALIFLVLGVGIGLSGSSKQADLEDQLAEVSGERDEAEDAVEDLESELDLTESVLNSTRADLQRAEAAQERAEAQVRRAEDAAAAAEEVAAPVESEPAESDGTYTVDDFTISDVQVSEDFVGDFEIRARVLNNGDSADFVQIQATLFQGGSVVSDLDAIEDFDAGEERTITFIGTDSYQDWDEIEFTVDEGF